MYIIDYFDKTGTKIKDKEFKTEKRALKCFDKLITESYNKDSGIGSLEIYNSETGDIIKEWNNNIINEELSEEEPQQNKSDAIAKFIEDIYDLRKQSIATEGEYGLGNLVFKEFRNLGYLDNLKELRKQEKGKELSLEQLEEEKAKLSEQNNYIINEYRKYACLKENDVITEENLNERALNRVSACENYDINELKELLLRGE